MLGCLKSAVFADAEGIVKYFKKMARPKIGNEGAFVLCSCMPALCHTSDRFDNSLKTHLFESQTFNDRNNTLRI